MDRACAARASSFLKPNPSSQQFNLAENLISALTARKSSVRNLSYQGMRLEGETQQAVLTGLSLN